MRVLYLIFCIILITQSLVAQDLRVTTYHVEHGLPTNLTKALIQDEYGFTWIGTDLGLIRFDGKNVMHYENELPSNFIKSFFKRKNGDLLVVNDKGISKINNLIDTVVFTTLVHGHEIVTDSTLYFPKTNSIYEDNLHNLWISEPHSIVKYANGRLKRYNFPAKNHTYSYIRSFTFVDDGWGGFLVASQPGFLYYYDTKTDKFIEIPSPTPFAKVGGLIKIDKGHFMIGCEGGVFELKLNEKKEIESFVKILNLNTLSWLSRDKQGVFYIGTWNDGLHVAKFIEGKLVVSKFKEVPFNVINYIYINQNDEVWVCGDEGIALLQQSFFNQLKVKLSRSYIQFLHSKNNQLFFSDGISINMIEKSNGQFSHTKITDNWNLEDILSITKSKDAIWFGTSRGDIYKIKNGQIEKYFKGKNTFPVYYLSADKDNNIWVCQEKSDILLKINSEGQITEYGIDKGISNRPVIIKQADNGKIYCGSVGPSHYLLEYNETLDRFVNISPSLPIELISIFSVEDLQVDKQNNIWLGTNHGLLKITKHATEHIPFNKKQPLQGVRAIAINHNGQVWIGTHQGIFKYEDNQFSLFDESNGLPSKTTSIRSLIIDADDILWAGTASGVGYSKLLSDEKKITPTPVFLALKVNGKRIDWENENVLKNDSYLEAEFVSLTYPAERNTYQYRVIGLNEDWISLGTQSKIMIPKIPDGEYTLQVRALRQGEYLWSPVQSYTFKVNIAWYLTWKAMVAYIVGLTFMLWAIVKLNTQRLQKEKQNLEKIINLRTAEILNQKEEITVQRDAIEEKRIALETALSKINKQNDKLKVLNATKDKFFSIIAHDLKGPLNSLSSFSDLLANHTDALSVEEIKMVAIDLNKYVKNTINLTENLLTWARSQMNKLTFRPAPINVNNLIQQTIDLLNPLAKGKNIEISVDLATAQTVFADEDQVRFILRNLMTNAIKFTLPGGKITVKTIISEGELLIAVSDSGVGINEEIKEKIFSLEQNKSLPGTAGEKGTGLGLLLCKEFVEKNKGQIWVESTLHKGSTFTFSLTLAEVIQENS